MDSNKNCFVCKRTVQILTSLNNESYKKGNQEQCRIFYSLVCRYVNLDIDLVDSGSSTGNNPKRTLKPNESSLMDDDSISCCDLCVPLIKSFCDTYNQWKLLQLVLNWKLETITKLMSLKTGNHYDFQKSERKGEMFRKALLDRVEDRSMEFPRLKLEKLEVQDSTFSPLSDPLESTANLDLMGSDNDDDDEPPFHEYHVQVQIEEENHIEIKEENVLESEIVNHPDARKDKRKQILVTKMDMDTYDDNNTKYDCNVAEKQLLKARRREKMRKCHMCEKIFSRSDSLRRHYLEMHERNAVTISCEWCDYKSKRSSNMRRHQKMNHAMLLAERNYENPEKNRIKPVENHVEVQAQLSEDVAALLQCRY